MNAMYPSAYQLLFFILLVPLFLAWELLLPATSSGVEQKPVAMVNGTPITEAELEKAIDTYIPSGAYHGSVGIDKRGEYRERALNLLIENELLYQDAKAQELTVDKKDVERIVEETKKRYKGEKDFEKALKSAGLTLDEFRKTVKRNELIKKLVKEKIEETTKYSDKELEDYYNANKGKFLRPEGFRVKHILIKVPPTATEEERKEIKNRATDILRKAKAGEDFSELASKYSEDAYRVKGGDLGWVHQGRLEKPIEEAVLKLKVGEISGLIETIFGYHIIKLEEKKLEEQLGFSEVRDSLKRELEPKRYNEVREKFLKTLKDKAKIEIY